MIFFEKEEQEEDSVKCRRGQGMGNIEIVISSRFSLVLQWAKYWKLAPKTTQLSHSVQFSPSVGSDSSRPHGPQHPRPPVHHQLSESTQTHVHRVSDAIQPSHPLLSPSPSAFKLSQHQGLFKWVNSSHQVSKILEFQLQHQSFQWTLRADLL